jgi:hypothetical protein
MRSLAVRSLCLAVMFMLLSGTARAFPKEGVGSPQHPGGPVSGSDAAVAPAFLTGTVLETIDAPPYVYLRLKTSKGEIWAAVNRTNVKKGSEVKIVDPLAMDGFESKTLKRKFDHIVFGTLAGTEGAAQPGPATGQERASATPSPNIAQLHANVSSASTDDAKIKVTKAEGRNGKTVAEIFSAKAALKETTVKVRGKVVKYNPGIMGKNWIHLRDGSGSSESKNNDIAVTTQGQVAVGDTVLVEGKLRLDRDFGSGYRYPVIIEDAKVSK